MVTIMPTTDGELVFMSRRRYLELCKTIDMLSKKIKKLEELEHARSEKNVIRE
jgi:hypothetical protein